jgi:hypothetical protein
VFDHVHSGPADNAQHTDQTIDCRPQGACVVEVRGLSASGRSAIVAQPINFCAGPCFRPLVCNTCFKNPFPSAWALSAAGSIAKGAIVRPVLKKPQLIGLVVFSLPKHTLVGFVPLGRHSGSKQRIRWNLKVNGKTLGNGTYEAVLKVFSAAGQPTSLRGPSPERLVISKGRIRIGP